MLDTNTVSHFVRQHPQVTGHIVSRPMSDLCISSITEGELLFGLAHRPSALTLHRAVNEFLRRVEVLAWDRTAAARYGTLRAGLQKVGKTLGSLDLLIAAHAMSRSATLISSDRAFRGVTGLALEDWAA